MICFLFLCVYLYPRILLILLVLSTSQTLSPRSQKKTCTKETMIFLASIGETGLSHDLGLRPSIDYLLNLNVHTSRTVNSVVFLHMLPWQQCNMFFSAEYISWQHACNIQLVLGHKFQLNRPKMYQEVAHILQPVACVLQLPIQQIKNLGICRSKKCKILGQPG